MFKTILLLVGIALVQARSYGEVSEEASAAPDIRTTPELGEALENGCPADFDIQFLLPHEACEKYYQCDEGKKIERDCQVGTVFNPDIQVCDWPYNVPRCENSPGATAPPTTPESSAEVPAPEEWEPLPNGCPDNFEISQLLPHESECGLYYACDQGELVEKECPPGLHFSPFLQTCAWPINAGCETQKVAQATDQELQEEWEALPNGCPANYTIDHLLPHESNCEKFYYCVHGGKVEYNCTEGTHFSPALQKCTWAEEAGCENKDASSRALVFNADCPECPPWPETPADRCRNGCNVAPWPHPECDKYYYCFGDQFRLGVCAEGLHFNPRTLTCDMICNAGCARIIPQITRHTDGLLSFVPNVWGNTAEAMAMIERELNAGL